MYAGQIVNGQRRTQRKVIWTAEYPGTTRACEEELRHVGDVVLKQTEPLYQFGNKTNHPNMTVEEKGGLFSGQMW